MMRCIVLADAAAVYEEAAHRIVALISRVQGRGRRCAIALAGGNTPRGVYRLLARSTSIDPAKLELFWSDERAVPPQHEDSNQHMARQTWLDHVDIPAAHIHPMRGDAKDLEAAAREYEELLHAQLGAPPRFDLVLLGLGSDGHTASLFPGCAAIQETLRTVAVTQAPGGARRLTLTPPALVASRMVLFVVTGRGKAWALQQVLHGEHDPMRYPPHALEPAQPLFLVDRSAAEDPSISGTPPIA